MVETTGSSKWHTCLRPLCCAAPSAFLIMVSALCRPTFISSMCHWTVKSKDTWHHMSPCAVMTAPSTAFMAAIASGGLVIRDMSRPQLDLLESAFLCFFFFFYTINTSVAVYVFTLWCSIIRKRACRLQFEIYNKIQREKKGGVKYTSRRRWAVESERCRMRDEDREKGGRPKACGVHDHFAWLHCD